MGCHKLDVRLLTQFTTGELGGSSPQIVEYQRYFSQGCTTAGS